LAAQLADCYGSLGGVLRRQHKPNEAVAFYEKGQRLEQTEAFRISNSYNQVQFLVLRILLDPSLLRQHDAAMVDELTKTIQILRRQIITTRSEDPWAYSDLGLLHTLLGDEGGAKAAWEEIDALRPIRSVYTSGLSVLRELAGVLPNNKTLSDAITRFETRAQES
jgi:hypothetical protein